MLNFTQNKQVVSIDSTFGKYKIPSSDYPLYKEKTIKVFTQKNTEKLEDEKIISLLNQLNPTMGRCYSNTEELLELFKKERIEKVQSYTGWLILSDGYPIHHCWTVINDKYLLDFSLNQEEMDFQKTLNGYTKQQAREKNLAFTIENENKPVAERMVLGQVLEDIVYVGSKSTPQMGRIVFNKLNDQRPNKYVVPGTDKTGASPIQQEYFKLKAKQGK